MTDKMRADTDSVHSLLREWWAGQITQHDFVWRAGAVATAQQIEQLVALPKSSERVSLVATANILYPR
jgi:hypothetical protein